MVRRGLGFFPFSFLKKGKQCYGKPSVCLKLGRIVHPIVAYLLYLCTNGTILYAIVIALKLDVLTET